MRDDNQLFHIAARHVSGDILDVGCGSGYLSEFVDGGYIGIDIGDRETVYGDAIICDVERDRFPFNDDSFDSVVMLEVLEHLLDYRHCMMEIRRVLKDEGVFVVSVPNAYQVYKFVRDFFGKTYETCTNDVYKHVVSFNRHTFGHLLRRCGFKIDWLDDIVGVFGGRYLFAVAYNTQQGMI